MKAKKYDSGLTEYEKKVLRSIVSVFNDVLNNTNSKFLLHIDPIFRKVQLSVSFLPGKQPVYINEDGTIVIGDGYGFEEAKFLLYHEIGHALFGSDFDFLTRAFKDYYPIMKRNFLIPDRHDNYFKTQFKNFINALEDLRVDARLSYFFPQYSQLKEKFDSKIEKELLKKYDFTYPAEKFFMYNYLGRGIRLGEFSTKEEYTELRKIIKKFRNPSYVSRHLWSFKDAEPIYINKAKTYLLLLNHEMRFFEYLLEKAQKLKTWDERRHLFLRFYSFCYRRGARIKRENGRFIVY